MPNGMFNPGRGIFSPGRAPGRRSPGREVRRPIMNTLSFVHRNNTLLDSTPSLLLQAVVIPGESTSEGQLIEAVALPWFDIMELIQRSPCGFRKF